MTSDVAWDDGPYRPFWEGVTGARRAHLLYSRCGSRRPQGRQVRTKSEEQRGYLDEHRTLMRWMERYPDAVCSLTHGFPWRTFLDDKQESIVLPDEIWEPFSNPNVSIEVCFPVRLGRYFRVSLPRGLAHAGRDAGTHRPQQPHVGHGHAIPEPLLHLPAVASVDQGTVRRLGRAEQRRRVADDGRDGRAGSGGGINETPVKFSTEPVSQSRGIRVSHLLHSAFRRNDELARRIPTPSFPLSRESIPPCTVHIKWGGLMRQAQLSAFVLLKGYGYGAPRCKNRQPRASRMRW